MSGKGGGLIFHREMGMDRVIWLSTVFLGGGVWQ